MALAETSRSPLFPFWFMQCEADLLHPPLNLYLSWFFVLTEQREKWLKIKFQARYVKIKIRVSPHLNDYNSIRFSKGLCLVDPLSSLL